MKTKLALALLTAALTTAPAHCGVLFWMQSLTAPANSTDNSLEVLLVNTGTTVLDISTFEFGVSVAAGAPVTFTSVTTDTVTPYIFGANSLFGPIISTSPAGPVMVASDLHDTSFVSLASGATVSLGRVHFDVGAGSGDFIVTLDPIASSLADSDFQSIPVDELTNGTIQVPGAPTVPEPASLLLFGSAMGALLIRRRRQSHSLNR
jgi:hypothetical protein